MDSFPFELTLKCCAPATKSEHVQCHDCLRKVKGRRAVYDAQWSGRAVIVKVFDRRPGARRHVRREWKGLKALHDRRIAAPRPLFWGRTANGQPAIVIEKIPNSSTLLETLNRTVEPTKREALLVQFAHELAIQHLRGVVQLDLHLGNYILDEHTIYAIDPWRMRFVNGELSRKQSISCLALFVRYIDHNNTDAIGRVCNAYFDTRQWKLMPEDRRLFEKYLIIHQERTLKKGLRKCLRTSKRHLRVDGPGYRGVFFRAFCRGTEPVELIDQVDELMRTGERFKEGNTCHVSRSRWNDQDIVIKRYNHKGWLYSLRHSFLKSRAKNAWLHGKRLEILAIGTPRPLAYIEKYRGPVLWESYLITEYVEGRKLYAFLSDDAITEQQRNRTVQHVLEVLENLHKYKISHGDLKHTNILLTSNGPVLTDLDGMKTHRWNWTYDRKKARDIAHFARGGRGAYTIVDAVEASMP